MMIKLSILIASLGGGLAVLLGAFGAHGLRGRIEDRLLETFHTAVEYQMYHSLALLLVAILAQQPGKSLALDVASAAFMLGMLLFSGSLYGLVLTDMKWLGPITPIGGLCFIVGWVALGCYGFQRFVG